MDRELSARLLRVALQFARAPMTEYKEYMWASRWNHRRRLSWPQARVPRELPMRADHPTYSRSRSASSYLPCVKPPAPILPEGSRLLASQRMEEGQVRVLGIEHCGLIVRQYRVLYVPHRIRLLGRDIELFPYEFAEQLTERLTERFGWQRVVWMNDNRYGALTNPPCGWWVMSPSPCGWWVMSPE